MNVKKVRWLNMFVTITLILVLLCAGIATWAQPGGPEGPPPVADRGRPGPCGTALPAHGVYVEPLRHAPEPRPL